MEENKFFYPSIQELTKTDLTSKRTTSKYRIEEKIDGSNFGFKLLDNKIVFQNKSGVVKPDSTTYIKGIINLSPLKHKLNPNFVYFGEYMKAIKANVAIYERVPKYNSYFTIFTHLIMHHTWNTMK